MRMYVKVMAAVIACILLSGEALSAFATTPATENLSWFKKKKKKPEEKEEKSKSDYEKLVEDSKTTKGMFAVHQKKNDGSSSNLVVISFLFRWFSSSSFLIL